MPWVSLAGDISMAAMRPGNTPLFDFRPCSKGLMLLLLIPAFTACSNEGNSDQGQTMTTEWYDPDTRMVKKSTGHKNYGREEGQWSYFHENGALKRQGSYKAGLKTGVWTGWYAQGAVKVRGSFLGDVSDGLWEEFYSNGVVAKRTSWVNGKIIGQVQKFHTDGQIWSVTTFQNGVPNGPDLSYHQDGSLAWTKDLVKGLPEGLTVGRHPGGGLHFIGQFMGGKTAGDWLFWHPGGEYKGMHTFDEKGNSLGTWIDFAPQGQALRSLAHGPDGHSLAQEWTAQGKRRSYGQVNAAGRPVGVFFVWQADGNLDLAQSGQHDGTVRTGPLSGDDLALAKQLSAQPDRPAPRPAKVPRREEHDPGQ